MIPAMLLFGYIAQRIGPARVAGGLAALVALGMLLTFTVAGKLQLIPLLMIFAGANVWFYALLSAMRCARPALMQQYLALYFTVCMIPGLAPLGLAWLLDRQPELTMSLMVVVATVAAVGFLLLDRRVRTQADAPAAVTVAEH